MSSAAFKTLSETQLNSIDKALMVHLSLDPQPPVISADSQVIPSYAKAAPSTGCRFIDGWREWERILRLNIAKNRAVKKQREDLIMVEPPFVPQDAAVAAAKAVSSGLSPLEGEIVIDKARWNAIDDLTGSDYFHRNNVFAYFLKLLLLERRQSFNAERGFNEYKTLYISIIESLQNTGKT